VSVRTLYRENEVAKLRWLQKILFRCNVWTVVLCYDQPFDIRRFAMNFAECIVFLFDAGFFVASLLFFIRGHNAFDEAECSSNGLVCEDKNRHGKVCLTCAWVCMVLVAVLSSALACRLARGV